MRKIINTEYLFNEQLSVIIRAGDDTVRHILYCIHLRTKLCATTKNAQSIKLHASKVNDSSQTSQLVRWMYSRLSVAGASVGSQMS